MNLGPSSAGPGPLPRAGSSPRCPHPPAEHSASAPEPGGGLGHAPRMALAARSVRRSPNEARAVGQPAQGVPAGSVGPGVSGRRWGVQAPELLPPCPSPSPAGWGRGARPLPPGPTGCSERGPSDGQSLGRCPEAQGLLCTTAVAQPRGPASLCQHQGPMTSMTMGVQRGPSEAATPQGPRAILRSRANTLTALSSSENLGSGGRGAGLHCTGSWTHRTPDLRGCLMVSNVAGGKSVCGLTGRTVERKRA